MARHALFMGFAMLALSLALPGAEAKNLTCKSYEPACGDITCCNEFGFKCLSVPIGPNEKQLRCVPGIETMYRQKWPFVVLLPLFFTPFILIATCCGGYLGFKNSGEAGWVGDILIVLGSLLTFFSLFLLYTPSIWGGVLIAFAGQLSVLMGCTASPRVLTVGLVAQMYFFLLWFNPFSNNIFLDVGSAPGNIFGHMDSMINAAATPAPFSWNDPNPVNNACSNFYSGYFSYNAAERGDGDNNPTIPTWGYCGLGWLMTVYFFMIGMFIMHVLIFVCTFLHWADITNREGSKLRGMGGGGMGGGMGSMRSGGGGNEYAPFAQSKGPVKEVGGRPASYGTGAGGPITEPP